MARRIQLRSSHQDAEGVPIQWARTWNERWQRAKKREWACNKCVIRQVPQRERETKKTARCYFIISGSRVLNEPGDHIPFVWEYRGQGLPRMARNFHFWSIWIYQLSGRSFLLATGIHWEGPMHNESGSTGRRWERGEAWAGRVRRSERVSSQRAAAAAAAAGGGRERKRKNAC